MLIWILQKTGMQGRKWSDEPLQGWFKVGKWILFWKFLFDYDTQATKDHRNPKIIQFQLEFNPRDQFEICPFPSAYQFWLFELCIQLDFGDSTQTLDN